jgi:hypothetical protein
MAKVTGPLLSIDASGKIGESIVFTRWRGTKVVRQFVKPANPNTAAQQTQRGYLTDAIAKWVQETPPVVQQGWRDFQAGQPISGVNEYVKRAIEALQDSKTLLGIANVVLTPGDDQITVALDTEQSVKCRYFYGTKHRVYSASVDDAAAGTSHSKAITGLTGGVLYYVFIGLETTYAATKWCEAGEFTATPT